MPIKKNKSLSIGALVLVVLFIVLYVQLSSRSRSIKMLDDFAVEDTASIDQIFLSDKAGNNILLQRKENSWLLNEKYAVNKEPLRILLETIKDLSVKTPVSKNKYETIIKQLAGKSVKVEVYQNNRSTPTKVYYVGHANQESSGSYMLLEGSDVPFLMHIEGFRGYLTPRYFTSEAQWRSTEIFKYDLYDIEEIIVEHHQNPEASFVIAMKEEQYSLYSYPGRKILPFDTAKVLLYAAMYKKVHYEFFEHDYDQQLFDSIRQEKPQISYRVLSKDGIQRGITTHLKKHEQPVVLATGGTEYYDIDRMYGIIDNKTLVQVQFFVFDALSRSRNYFLP